MRGKRREQNDFDVGSLFPAAFGSDHDDGSARSGWKSWITEYIVPFGTLLIAALALLAQHVSLPTVVGQRSSSTFSLQPAPPFTDLLCGRFGGLPSNAPKRGSRDRAVLACLRRFVT